MKVLPSNTRSCRKGSADYFTGTVFIDEVITSSAPSRFKSLRVSFEPDARTAWHTHPRGQALHVLTGVGLVQLTGQSPQTILPGDSVWIEAGELHWHGAAPGHTMVHLAIQEVDDNGADAVWSSHVTDEEYSQSPA